LFCRRGLLEALPFPKLAPAPEAAPERAETGTQNHEGIAGAAAAVEFLAALAPASTGSRRERLRASFAALHARGAALFEQLWRGLDRIEGVTLYGQPPGTARTPTAAFTLSGVTSTEVARRLAARGVFVSHGDFYAATVIERLGLGEEGLVRAGCSCYTTAGEVERLVSGIREIALKKS
jgi:selenocysteine lyase/cysteine desulfurase